MIPGDLLRARSVFRVGLVRIYEDDQCESWQTYMSKWDVVVLLEEFQNRWDEGVCKVLFPRGIRWVYKMDVEVMQSSESKR